MPPGRRGPKLLRADTTAARKPANTAAKRPTPNQTQGPDMSNQNTSDHLDSLCEEEEQDSDTQDDEINGLKAQLERAQKKLERTEEQLERTQVQLRHSERERENFRRALAEGDAGQEKKAVATLFCVQGNHNNHISGTNVGTWIAQTTNNLHRANKRLTFFKDLIENDFSPDTDLKKFLTTVMCTEEYSPEKLRKISESHAEERLDDFWKGHLGDRIGASIVWAAIVEWVFKNPFPETELFEDFEILKEIMNGPMKYGELWHHNV